MTPNHITKERNEYLSDYLHVVNGHSVLLNSS